MPRLLKNALGPEQTPHGGDGVGEGRFALGVPTRCSQTDSVPPGMLGKDQADHAEEAQQAGSRSQNGLGHPLSRRLESQVGATWI